MSQIEKVERNRQIYHLWKEPGARRHRIRWLAVRFNICTDRVRQIIVAQLKWRGEYPQHFDSIYKLPSEPAP